MNGRKTRQLRHIAQQVFPDLSETGYAEGTATFYGQKQRRFHRYLKREYTRKADKSAVGGSK